jgi:sulfur transfer complex TusBCD TusB component (DsrH family)
MPGPVVCSQCDKDEQHCTCDKYCTICKSLERVRLCQDGLYYCPDCREACEVSVVDNRAH